MNPELYRVLARIATKAAAPIPKAETPITDTAWQRFFTRVRDYMGA
jgi:hypothetical protein